MPDSINSNRPRLVTRTRRLTLILGAALALLLTLTPLAVGTSAQAQTADPTPLPLYSLPDARTRRAYTSSSIALAGDGPTAIAVNTLNNTATILVPRLDRVVAEISVGLDPRSVALTLDGARAVVTNRGDNSLSLIDMNAAEVVATYPVDGVWPYGVVVGDASTAYVSLQGSSAIAVVDLVSGATVDRIAVPAHPAGLALWGDFLYVTHFWSGDLTMIYAPQRRVIQTVRTGADLGISAAIEIDITRGIAYLPQTRANTTNIALTYDTTVFPLVNVLNLRDLSVDRSGRIALDTADQPVNMPFALALDRFRRRLYVANAGSNSVSAIDLDTGLARANIAVGSNPRGLVLNRDNTLLYVHNTLDGTVSTIQTDRFEVTSVLPISDLTIPVDVLIGAQLFYGAADPRISAAGWLSCANCHFDGMSDGRVWSGFTDGPRNTPLLYALPETVPYNWSGTWDELGQIEHKIRALHAGAGLIEGISTRELLDLADENQGYAGLSADLDLLTAYLTTLRAPANPAAFAPEVLERGAQVFTEQACADCHVGPAGTNLQSFDVGTGGSPLERGGPSFDTPTLRWLWLSAPYFHDGSAATLRQVFEHAGEHQLIFDVSPADIDALVSYLLSLPQPEL
jgi:YVTN family beta-propeller protein